jgi:segregation and condensation protein A
MNAPVQNRLQFDAATAVPTPDEPLMLDLEVWEGPLHVLLELAKAQKVDLRAISVTRLADQFLAFVREAKGRRFALAADYLVMAAWLTYLKSRLLLPKPEAVAAAEEPAEDVAQRLALRLLKLDAVRRAAAALEARPMLRRDVFPRGDPQAAVILSHDILEGDLHGLMSAYVGQRRRVAESGYRPPVVHAWRLDDAREHLRHVLPGLSTWTALDAVAPEAEADGPVRASMVASTLSAGLEFVKDGALDMRQSAPFADVYLRARAA